MYHVHSWFFEVLKLHKLPIFIVFTNMSAKSSGTAMGASFFQAVKFHEWSTSMKFTEFTCLKKPITVD